LIRSGQNELELNAEQRSQLAEIERQAPDVRNAMRAAFDKYRTANNSVDRDKLREELSRISSEARKKEQDQIRKVLTEEKFARAQQLYWQSLGSRALTMREFVEELKITPNQRNQMSEISRSFSRSRFPSSPDTRPTREDAARIAAEREKKMLEVLTDEQRAALKKKLGAPAKKE
jgi:Spy/CpxP family protein refolding chaperone